MQGPLPGEEAHMDLSPMGRGKSSEALKRATTYRNSGVAIHLFDPENPKLLLMQRPSYPGTHGGQISFPGGKEEEQDRNLLETALRESEEEVGLPKDSGEVLGELTEIYIPVSKFRVVPFVILHQEANPRLVLEEKEVESTFYLPLRSLLNPKLLQEVDITLGNGTRLPKIPSFVYQEKVIWGATAIILNELKTLLLENNY